VSCDNNDESMPEHFSGFDKYRYRGPMLFIRSQSGEMLSLSLKHAHSLCSLIASILLRSLLNFKVEEEWGVIHPVVVKLGKILHEELYQG
jgi:hypothetical protein